MSLRDSAGNTRFVTANGSSVGCVSTLLLAVTLLSGASCSASDDSGSGMRDTTALSGVAGSTGPVGASSGISVARGSDPVVIAKPPPAPVMAQPDCDNELEVTYRDFTEAHEDFEMPNFSGDVVRLQLVENQLGADSKPVFRDSIGCPPTHEDPTLCDETWKPAVATIHSAASFKSWYNTVSGVNAELQKTLKLMETRVGSGVFVFDSNAFFPIEPKEGLGLSPKNGNQGKNFLFTTEIHLLFTYVAGQKFSFKGDDDLWIFINNKLALDLGSMHRAESGEIDFDLKAAALGIAPGGQYNMDVFHAERHTSQSNFRIETNIACFVARPPLVF